MPESSPTISTEQLHGATIRTVYGEREVRILAVLENEVSSLSTFNMLTTVFLSVGASLISLAVGIWTNAAFASQPTPEGTILSRFVGPLLCALSLVMFGLAHWAYKTRKSTLDTIRSETKSKTA